MNSRRALLRSLGAAALAPLISFAQGRGKPRRIVFFYFGSRKFALESNRYLNFLKGMRELGYLEGRDFVMEARYADGSAAHLQALAADVVALNPDVIVATGGPVYRALRKTTQTIPIVVTVTTDPVADGLAETLARPGKNTTGLSTIAGDAIPKLVELLKSVQPKLAHVAVLVNPTNGAHPVLLRHIQLQAEGTGVTAEPVSASTVADLERAFEAAAREHDNAVIVLPDTFYVQEFPRIARLAIEHKLPSIHADPNYAVAGGLMSYGADVGDNFLRASFFVDKILRGAKPGDLPFEQPTRVYLTINRKTANAIGLAIPHELLLRADKVIE